MKRLSIISGFLMISLIAGAQINFDSTAYKASYCTAYVTKSDGEVYKTDKYPSTMLFFFTPQRMLYQKGIEKRNIFFTESPRTGWLQLREELPHLAFLNSKDFEGSRCAIFITYDTEKECYYISVVYSNVNFTFECQLTDERPWDNDPITVKDMIEEGKSYRGNPQYTDEEIDAFFQYLEEETGIKAGVAKTFIMNEFIQDIAQ